MTQPIWKKIMIHHSLSKDGITRDWDAIRKYHMSYRFQGSTIPREYAQTLMRKGVRGVLKPWADIGYHGGCEFENNAYIIQTGRPMTIGGAHCPESGMNHIALGFCFVGNFDINPPKTEQLTAGGKKILEWAKEFEMGEPEEYIKYHNEFATYKSCPGKFFPSKENFITFLKRLMTDQSDSPIQIVVPVL